MGDGVRQAKIAVDCGSRDGHLRVAVESGLQLYPILSMRLLHTMLRVGNLQRSIDFYTTVLGMKLLRISENPQYKYSLAFVGYGNNPEHAQIELTYNHGVESYDLGSGYGHIALGVGDVAAACEKIKQSGGNVTREAGPVKGGSTVIAFVTDPDGYKIELIQRAEVADDAEARATQKPSM